MDFLHISIPIVFPTIGNIDAQWRRQIVQLDPTVALQRPLQIVQRLEFHIAKAFELIRFPILHQPHVLHLKVLEYFYYIALHQALRQVADECDKGRFLWQLLRLPVATESASEMVRKNVWLK